MRKMIFGFSPAGMLALGLVITGCTRKASDTAQISLSMPTQYAVQMSADSKLSSVIVNVRIPGTPEKVIEREFEYRTSGVLTGPAPGATFDLILPDVPRAAGILVQVLTVFESQSTGQLAIQYDDDKVDTSNGDATAIITTTEMGNASKQGRVQGRYVTAGTSFSDASGPTGTLVTYLQPPFGAPPMSVNRSSIYNGWFNIFVLDSAVASLTYKVEETSEILFSNLTLSSTELVPTAYRLRFRKPVTYRRNGETDPEMELIQGYFISPSLTGFSLTGLKACFPTFNERIGFNFRDAGRTDALPYRPTGNTGTAFELTVAGAGYGLDPYQMFTSGVCSWSNGTLFYPHLMSFGGYDEGPFGVRGPFRVIDPYAEYGAFLRTRYSSANGYDLQWAYLPGVTSASGSQIKAVDGVTVFANSSNIAFNNGGGNENMPCDQLAVLQGYTPLGDVLSTAAQPTEFNIPVGTAVSGVALNGGSFKNFRFTVCPFRVSGTDRLYYPRGIDSGCVGNCSGFEHFGWVDTAALTIGSPFTYTAAGGWTGRVSTATFLSAGDLQTTKLSFATAPVLSAGDEVMIQVVAEGTPSACSVTPPYNVQVGQIAFARVLNVNSAPGYIEIPRSTFMDTMVGSPGTAALSAAPPVLGTSFCFVQVAKVLHYTNLTMNQTIVADPFNFTSGGGVVPVRVSGVMSGTSAFPFKADGMGFPGGAVSLQVGASRVGDVMAGLGTYAGTGNGSSAHGGGGGGYGAGGSSSTLANSGGISDPTSTWLYSAAMGAGGGAGSQSIALGGRGGGFVFAAVNTLNLNTAAFIFSASGDSGGDFNTGSSTGGAGGGGRVVFVGDRIISSANQLALTARGGNSIVGGAAAGTGAGSGGGGSTSALVCSGAAYVNSATSLVDAGIANDSTMRGFPGLQSITSSPTYGLCNRN